MNTISAVVLIAGLALATGQITPAQNYNPTTITVNAAPFDVISTPITPVAPYSQAAYQCNLTGDARYPPFASGTYPLTVRVPVGQRVRVIFANGNLNGATLTQGGEPGVIVQQGGSPIVQQAGGASPIVQPIGSPVVQPNNAPPAMMRPMQAATVVQQQPAYPQSPIVQQPSSPIVQQSPSTPAAAATTRPASPVVQQTPSTPAAAATTRPASPVVQQTPSTPAAAATTRPASPIVQQSSPVVQQQSPSTPAATTTTPASPIVQQSSPVVQQQSSPVVQQGRRLLQDTVPGGPNNGLVEYVALVSANTVPGFVVPNTQFGVPYVEFTASAAAAGQTATFKGALSVATVVGGVPLYPFQRSAKQSPDCQVNVNFVVA